MFIQTQTHAVAVIITLYISDIIMSCNSLGISDVGTLKHYNLPSQKSSFKFFFFTLGVITSLMKCVLPDLSRQAVNNNMHCK